MLDFVRLPGVSNRNCREPVFRLAALCTATAAQRLKRATRAYSKFSGLSVQIGFQNQAGGFAAGKQGGLAVSDPSAVLPTNRVGVRLIIISSALIGLIFCVMDAK